ncbi:MAG: LysM peptidoglycan-binding domain-containing protein [Actinobacteria bacterium]|nr:LysM peptidoglycan-binding domain-containing protein [Actinomycetota bacterium]
MPACPEAAFPGAAGHDERAPVAAVVALLALMVLGWPLAGLVGGATTAAEGSRPSPAPVAMAAGSVHVVQPGETYWSIARGLGGPGDVRPTVDALMAANGERPLVAGDRLLVPLGE